MTQNLQPISISETNTSSWVTLTPQAIAYVQTYKQRKPDAKDKALRISVEGGGCSGFQYAFSFDPAQQDDMVLHFDDVQVVIDPQTRLYIKDSSIDYVDDLKGSGFVVNNPNAKGTCGCGVSFSV